MCSEVTFQQSLLKIVRKILFWETGLGVAESFGTRAIAAVLLPTRLVELQPSWRRTPCRAVSVVVGFET